MSRWSRSSRLLQAPAGSQVLDLGCAFGFGTRLLTTKYTVVGLDGSATFIRRAKRSQPQASFVVGDAQAMPFEATRFDAVVCLDVIEHLADEEAAMAEIRRILKPNGELVLSVPHRGALERCDSLNVYQRRTGRSLAFPISESPSGSSIHRHYDLSSIRRLCSGFEIDAVQRTGAGIAEIINIGLLAGVLGFRARPARVRQRLYNALQALYFAIAVAESDLSLGMAAYNLMIHARKAAEAS